jgi:hypothetical protein
MHLFWPGVIPLHPLGGGVHAGAQPVCGRLPGPISCAVGHTQLSVGGPGGKLL